MTTNLSHQQTVLWADLEHVVRSLGQGGGHLNPSVYDTAQCFRFDPPANPWPVVDWLLSEQQPDGGWGQSSNASMRMLSTLSAILALKTLPYIRQSTQTSIDNGRAFLYRHQWHDWSNPNHDHAVGMEVLFSRLLEDARKAQLPIDCAPYTNLIANGERQRRQLQRAPRQPDKHACHIWEGWGDEPLPHLVDHRGTVGGSPAASVYWLSRARSMPHLAALCERVEQGLKEARAATNSSIDHVVCTRWPITDDERIFGLYVLVLGGMIGVNQAYEVPPTFRIALDQQLAWVRDTLIKARTDLLGRTPLEHDTKSVAITVLLAGGYQLPNQMLQALDPMAVAATDRWIQTDSQRLATVGHNLHALGMLGSGRDGTAYQEYLYQNQAPTGLWASQSPQASVQSTTTQMMVALLESGAQRTIPTLCHTLSMFQQSNGAWGEGAGCTEETAYAVLALLAAKRHRCLPKHLDPVLQKARQWMCGNYHPFNTGGSSLWRGKELYRPIRIARIAEIAAILGLLYEANPA